jgi:phosphoribosylanthranilate isomerase
MPTRIKICGIRTPEAALAAADAGADAIGFMFARFSPRFIEPEDAFAIQSGLPPCIATVGVFVNPDLEDFCDIEEACPTTHTQLHGNEPEPLVKQLGPVIKAIRFQPDTIAAELFKWGQCEDVEAVLIDGSAGGEGLAFDWKQLVPHVADFEKPIFLAGGLNPANVGEAIRTLRPYAVDVSSGVEREKGVKDEGLIAAFCEAVREADRA